MKTLPIASIHEKIYTKKSPASCVLSNTPIHQGDLCYQILFMDEPYVEKTKYAHKTIADNDVLFSKNIQAFKAKTYDVSLLNEAVSYHTHTKKRVEPYLLNFEKGLDWLNNPLKYTCLTPYYYHNPNALQLEVRYEDVSSLTPAHIKDYDTIHKLLQQHFLEQIETDGEIQPIDTHKVIAEAENQEAVKAVAEILSFKNENQIFIPFRRESDFIRKVLFEKESAEKIGRTEDTFYILSLWLHSTFYEKLITNYNQLSDELKILLSLSDLPLFMDKLEQNLNIKDWRNLCAVILDDTFNLESIHYITTWSEENKAWLPMLSAMVYKYEFYYPENALVNFTKMYEKGKIGRLIYLFTNHLEYFPIVKKVIQTKKTPISLYMSPMKMSKCHLYLTAIYHLYLAKKYNETVAMIDYFKTQKTIYTPTGFMNILKKIEKLISKQT